MVVRVAVGLPARCRRNLDIHYQVGTMVHAMGSASQWTRGPGHGCEEPHLG